jgi:hypothetical protein
MPKGPIGLISLNLTVSEMSVTSSSRVLLLTLTAFGCIVGVWVFASSSPAARVSQTPGSFRSTYDAPSDTCNAGVPPVTQVQSLLRLAKFDCQDKPLLVRHVKDALVVEVGAFDGTETVELAKEASVRRVISYEPTSTKAKGIVDRFAASGVGNKIEFRQKAVSVTPGRVKFYVPESGGTQQDSLTSVKFLFDN